MMIMAATNRKDEFLGFLIGKTITEIKNKAKRHNVKLTGKAWNAVIKKSG